jgi:hypothetical protein
MIKKALLLLMAGASLTIAATVMQADQVRWHRNFDNSMLLDDDKYGQRIVLPKDYHAAQITADRHYAEMNPDSVTKLHGGGISISYDVAPTRIVTDDELATWARANAATWWQFDLLTVVYRNIEKTAVVHATEDPERAQAILDRKRAEEHIPEPSPALVEDLARHNITYTHKAAAYGGQTSWYFDVKDPAGSAKKFGVLVSAGSSEKEIMDAIYKECARDERVPVFGPSSEEKFSWVRW